MSRWYRLAAAVLFLALFSLPLRADTMQNSPKLDASRLSAPIAFTKNMGQWPDSILYRGGAGGVTVWITADGAYYQLSRRVPVDTTVQSDPGHPAAPQIQTSLVRARLIGAAGPTEVSGTGPMAYKCNYFLGNDPSKWRTDVSNYESVIAKDVYPGIDLTYYGNGGRMEYDFVVQPGARYQDIRMAYEGAEAVDLSDAGEVILRVNGGTLSVLPPTVYQIKDGVRESVKGGYALEGDGTIGFELASGYDPALAVVIDPVLVYSTYLGGGGTDVISDIKVNSYGEVYATGQTASSNFPMLNQYQTDQYGMDAFIAKLTANGSSLLFSTYLGGSDADSAAGIAIGDSGYIYVAGGTGSPNFPILNQYQTDRAGDDIFVTKFSPSGNSLIYSTYLGGSGGDFAADIAEDSGRAYVVGYTQSSDFPTVNALQTDQGGADGIVVKFDQSGSSLVYGTYIGGDVDDHATSVAVDSAGCAYVTGDTKSANNFPVVNAFQANLISSLGDAFVCKFAPNGMTLSYSTYLGGNDRDYGLGIAVRSGNAYVTGQTGSGNFPLKNPYQATRSGQEVFVSKLGAAGDSLVYSTYLGGGGAEEGDDIAVDQDGNAYITGSTSSSSFPLLNPSQSSMDHVEAFVTEFGPTGTSLVWSTFLGGHNDDVGQSIALDHSGSVYVAGYTNGSDFPVSNQYQSDQGGTDAFIAKFQCSDTDADGVCDFVDNCPAIPNASQVDADSDGIGDACDVCTDTDHDGFGNPGYLANTCTTDNCPTVANPTQSDADGDGIGDACDPCTDTDGDGSGNPGFVANTCTTDNCPDNYNPDQRDGDGDGIGDVCDAVPTSGLVAYYPFAGDALDWSGNGNNGTVYGPTLTIDRFGQANQAFQFDGVNDTIVVPDATSLNFNYGSICIWAYFNGHSTGNPQLVSKGGQYEVLFNYASGQPVISGAVNSATTNSIMRPDSARWSFLCLTKDGSNIKLYEDGVLIQSTASAGTITPTANKLLIGRTPSSASPSDLFKGKLDDIRIYNRALTDLEIKQLFYEGKNADPDGDALPDYSDNAPVVYNPDQTDANGNSIGDTCESNWRASSGNLASQVCPPWTLTKVTDTEIPQLQGDSLVLSTSSASERLYYSEIHPDLTAPPIWIIEFQMRLASAGSSPTYVAPFSVAFSRGSGAGNYLWIAQDEIFLWSSPNTRGAFAPLDTDGSLHTYRIQVDADGDIRVYYDGVLKLTGSEYANASWASMKVAWGAGIVTGAFGTSKIIYFTHNGFPLLDSDGDLKFNPCDNCPTMYNPSQADFDGDGIGDLCDPNVDVTPTPDTTSVFAMVQADVDGDNHPDFIYTGRYSGDSLSIAYGKADGTLERSRRYLTFPMSSLAIGYINGDTLLDIVAKSNTERRILLNQGNRNFNVLVGYSYGRTVPEAGAVASVAIGRFNADAYMDYVAATDIIAFGNGTGNFSESTLPFTFSAVGAADFDNDGDDDLAVVRGDSAFIYLNNGAATFSRVSAVFLAYRIFDIATVLAGPDFNKDGKADYCVITARQDSLHIPSIAHVVLNNGSGGVLATDTFTIDGLVRSAAVNDVDRDKNLDLSFINSRSSKLELYYGNGSGTFPDSSAILLSNGPQTMRAVATGDLNRDGNPDYVSGGDSTAIVIATNDLPPDPVLGDELVATGRGGIDISEINPQQFVVGRTSQTIGGAAYWQSDFDHDNIRDVRTFDYNLQNGEYCFVIRRTPLTPPDGPIFLDIRVDGSKYIAAFVDYVGPSAGFANAVEPASDSLIFYYTVESTPSMSPPNGEKTATQTPVFRWGKLVDTVTATKYQFQLGRYYDLSAPRYDLPTLLSPTFTPPAPLGKDSVFYWRARAYNGTAWGPWTRTLAAYIGAGGCCLGTTGNVNTLGIVDVSDLSLLVAYLTTNPPPVLPCPGEANVNTTGIIDVSDLSLLVAYLTTNPPPVLPNCP